MFPVDNTIALLKRASTHKKSLDKAKTLAEAAKPDKFSKDLVWDEWENTFVNFLRSIPGRNGIPLQYVIRENEQADPTPNDDFLDDYIKNAPLVGEAFIIDANEVHTHLINLIAHNNEADSITKLHEMDRKGRIDWMSLNNHYEGQGVYTSNIIKAEHDLNNLNYTGEKKPHIWWTLFEQRLSAAFQAYVKFENRVVQSDSHKLRILTSKVKCDWMGDVKWYIKTKLQEKPLAYTYQQALLAFKTEVKKSSLQGPLITPVEYLRRPVDAEVESIAIEVVVAKVAVAMEDADMEEAKEEAKEIMGIKEVILELLPVNMGKKWYTTHHLTSQKMSMVSSLMNKKTLSGAREMRIMEKAKVTATMAMVTTIDRSSSK